MPSILEDIKFKKEIILLGSATYARSHTPASSQPAMPQMISLLFICKTGAVGVAQMILLFDFWREAENATWKSLIRDELMLLL